MKFNGIDLADRYASSAGGYFIVNDVRGRGVIGSEVDMIDVPGRDGSYVVGKRRPPRALEVDITLKGDSYEDLRKKIEDLNALLSTETDAEIVFDDEPDRVYYGRLAEVNDKLEKSKIYQATLTFICPDPYKYGPLRTQTINVPPASFSRNSVAYLSDGTQVAANQPRFENGGILVEEGTTNLFANPKMETTTSWSVSHSGTLSSVDVSTIAPSPFGNQKCIKITSASGQSYVYIYQQLSLQTNTNYTVSFVVYVPPSIPASQAKITVFYVDSGWKTLQTIDIPERGTWVRKTLTFTSHQTISTHVIGVGLSGIATSGGLYCYASLGQLEQKPYATSFVDGTRQPETLTLPTDGVLNPQEGTIEVEFDYQNLNRWKRLVSFIGSAYPQNAINGYYDQHLDISPTGSVRFQIIRNRDTGEVKQIASAGGLSNGRHIVAANWGSDGISLYIDGIKVASNSYNGGFKQLDDTITIGRDNEADAGYLGGYVRNLRISRIARSDAEILDAYQNGFTVDEYTTAYLDFENNLEVQTPNIVVNEGTAETYPTFTAYVKQPITFLDIIAPDAYMRVGQPYEVSQTPVDGDKPVMKDEMTTTTGWGAATSVVDGVVQGTMVSDGERFVVQSYGPTYNGWAGPALKKSLPNPLQDFRVHALIDITSSANGTGRIEIYGLDTANNIVFRMSIGDFSAKAKDVKAFWGLGASATNVFTTYGKKTGSLNDYYGSLIIERKGNRWKLTTAKRASQVGVYQDFVEKTYIDTKNQYTAQLAQIQVHIGTHLGYGPIDHMSINHVYVYDLHNQATDQIPYIAYPDDILQFDHKNAVIYRNGEPIMAYKDFGARFFPLAPGETELAVNPSDSAIVTVEYRPRFK